jgi:hypothetical protein
MHDYGAASPTRRFAIRAGSVRRIAHDHAFVSDPN